MATIEETIISPLQQRAIDYCDKKQMPKLGRQIAVIAYMHGATEQDRIARQEERKKCINAFCKIECGRLANETCPNTDSCILDCKKYKSFCKAIEEDEKEKMARHREVVRECNRQSEEV